MRKKRAQQFLFLEAESLTLSLFYRYYFGRCSSELAQLVPLPFSWRRSTCYYDRLLDFSVTIPRCYKDIYSNSFFLKTTKLWNSMPIKCFSLKQAWWGRKKQAPVAPLTSFYPRWVVNYRWSKKYHFSFTLSCQLSCNKLVAKARNKTLLIMQKLFLFLCVCVCVCVRVCVCICVVSQFDLSITKRNYLFVRCQSLSYIPNTSWWYSNQPLWKLNLMTGVNMTKQ